jgi:carbon monoxide dehydrogenase subunit G
VELSNEFRVSVPIEEAWAVLTDVERIAPCMPGAQLQEVEGDEFRGIVKVKVGPMTAQYKGVAQIVEQDDTSHRAVLRAEGRETKGQGNANATITAQLEPDGDGTRITVVTDLTITGKVAQFGRGVLADVSAKLLDQFASCLETKLLNGETPEAATETPTEAVAPPAAVRAFDGPEAEPVDLLDAAGAPVARRLAPVVAGVVVLVIVVRLRRRRRRRRP